MRNALIGTTVMVVLGTSALLASCMNSERAGEPTAEQESALTICVNGGCDPGETCATGPGDCGSCSGNHCGDGTCDKKETCTTCARDCGSCPGCGNGVCNSGETCANCPADCGRCSGEHCG